MIVIIKLHDYSFLKSRDKFIEMIYFFVDSSYAASTTKYKGAAKTTSASLTSIKVENVAHIAKTKE